MAQTDLDKTIERKRARIKELEAALVVCAEALRKNLEYAAVKDEQVMYAALVEARRVLRKPEYALKRSQK